MFGLAPQDKFTYEEYCHLPEGDRRELIEGELLVTPAPSERHQRISGHIEFELRKYLEEHPVGVLYHAPFDVILDQHSVVQPDIIVILDQGKGAIVPEGLRGAPDLVIEILSPSTAGRDFVYKRRLYHKFKVQEYWIVDPDNSRIEQFLWEEQDYRGQRIEASDTLASPLLPNLVLNLAKVFKPLSR